jgi:type IV fimbrial biogenesis protein FimT
MLIVIAIIAIATTLGIPSYRAWMQNTQIYNAAESIQNGVQKARAEAVKQNANIEFVLGTSTPWKIQLPGNTALCPVYGPTLLECSISEGSKNVVSTATPANATTVTFSNFGGVVTNADGTASLRQIDFNSAVLPTSSRNLTVTIGILNAVTHVWVGSNVRMCDPNPNLTSTDPRKC